MYFHRVIALLNTIKTLCNLCLHNALIPTKWNNAVTVLLDKKEDKTDLNNYRPISHLNHLYKLFTRIITSCLENKLDFYQTKEQTEFRSGFETNDHLHTIKLLIEKSVEYNRALLFLDILNRVLFLNISVKAFWSSYFKEKYVFIYKKQYIEKKNMLT